ncbi:MAG TPA: hypothetical protein VF897_11220 [Roseiflexaceae bacterium]
MRTLHKTLVGLGLAGVVALSIVWGDHSATIRRSVRAVAEDIQKPGHLALGEIIVIQKPGH